MNDPHSLRIKDPFNCEFWKVWSHPYPGNRVAIGLTVVYYAQAAHAFSAEIKCRHCN